MGGAATSQPATAEERRALLAQRASERMDVFVTDGRLVDHSLSAKPYTDHAFDMPAQYAAPDGLDLRLYGRSADGESVVVEKNIESLSIALILDVNFPDANAALRELKKRMGEHDVSRLCMKMAVKRRF